MKVGGHQASSASLVSVMTALWFDGLTSAGRMSVKPHASPVQHVIKHLLGELDASFLPKLREFGGLQPYPSRAKDPDPPAWRGAAGLPVLAGEAAPTAARLRRSLHGTAGVLEAQRMTSSEQVEYALVLAESSLSAAQLAHETAKTAEAAAVEAARLALVALDAVQEAYDHAQQARADG